MFSIIGTGAVNYVKDWAKHWGWKETVIGEDGEETENPVTDSQHITNYIFELSKVAVVEERKKARNLDVEQEIKNDVNENISLG